MAAPFIAATTVTTGRFSADKRAGGLWHTIDGLGVRGQLIGLYLWWCAFAGRLRYCTRRWVEACHQRRPHASRTRKTVETFSITTSSPPQPFSPLSSMQGLSCIPVRRWALVRAGRSRWGLCVASVRVLVVL